jgi:protein TonB
LVLGLLGACAAPAAPPPRVVDVMAPAPPPAKADDAPPELPPEPAPELPRVAAPVFEPPDLAEEPKPGEMIVTSVRATPVGAPPPSGSVSREELPRLAGPLACAFPLAAQGDDANVPLEVFVSASGAVTRVGVLRQPGEQLFATTALECVTRTRFVPGRGPDGSPKDSRVVVHVRFSR